MNLEVALSTDVTLGIVAYRPRADGGGNGRRA